MVASGRARTPDVPDLVARGSIAGLFLGLAYRIGLNVLETGQVSGLLLLTSEMLVVVLTIVRRQALQVDRTALVRGIAIVSIVPPFLLRPDGTHALVPEFVILAISSAGLAIVVAGKMALGRSFGLLPANRGVVQAGLYRLVRHPIYLGYLLTHVAFLLGTPTTWNIVALVTADTALLVRAWCEERMLLVDPTYQRYHQTVPWRLLPGIY